MIPGVQTTQDERNKEPVVFVNRNVIANGDLGKIVANNDQTIAEHCPEMKSTGPSVNLDKLMILVFACTGNGVVHMSREYPSGYYVEFLQENNLNENIGTLCLSIHLLTSALSPYLFSYLPPRILHSSLIRRTFILLLINMVLTAVLACVDTVVEQDPSGNTIFGIIAVVRSVQGLVAGLLFVMFQGELVDLYLSDNKFLMVIISSTIYLGMIISTIGGTELYIAGGWLYASLGMGAFNMVPIALLPLLHRSQLRLSGLRHGHFDVNEDGRKCEVEKKGGGVGKEQEKLTPLRSVAFYLPDIAMFFSNIAYVTMFYVLPARMVKYNIETLSNAVFFLTILLVVGFIFAVIYGLVADKKIDVILLMAFGSLSLYVGLIIVYGSTTEFLSFPHAYKIGYVIAGLGDPAFLTVTIMSKFVLYEKWNVGVTGLGEKAAAVYNISFNVATAIGIALSGLTLSRASEVPTLATAGTMCVIGLICYAVCKSIK